MDSFAQQVVDFKEAEEGNGITFIPRDVTVNGTVVAIEAGYEVDYIEPKTINGKNMIIVNIVKDDSTKAILIDSLGRNAAN